MSGHESQRRWRGTMIVSLIGISIMVATTPQSRAAAVATDFSDPTFQNGRQLPDHELAQLRGKAVNSREILFFGVEMSTRWQTSAGEDIHARANLGFDMAGAQPSPQFSTHITSTTPEEYVAYQQAINNTAPGLSSGSINAEGVVQLVQAGGDFNSANNAFWVDVGQDAGRGSSLPANNKLTETTQSGAQVAIGRQAGELGMTLSVPGAGVASQGIRSSQGLHQSIRLTSDHQQISNMTRLHVQLGKTSNTGITNEFKNLLQSVRSLERL